MFKMKNKKLIEKLISKELNITIGCGKDFTNTFISIIKENSFSKNIKLSGFGTFYRHKTPKRIGRNPKTKESYIIQPRIKINFKPSKKIKEVLN